MMNDVINDVKKDENIDVKDANSDVKDTNSDVKDANSNVKDANKDAGSDVKSNVSSDVKIEKEKRQLTKKDIALIVVIVLIALLSFGMHELVGGKGAGCVTVKVAGEITGVYSLAEDREISINGGTNILKIHNGSADMIEADCPDKLCVNQKKISKNGESIICLPNKVVVTIDSNENSEFDAVAQ